MDYPKRKKMRLPDYDYRQNGGYFVTICTKDRQQLLSRITSTVGVGALDDPFSAALDDPHPGALDDPLSARKDTKAHLTEIGKTVEKYLLSGEKISGVTVDRYVIMPNHVHLLLVVNRDGPSGTPVPTIQNSTLSRFVSTLKRFCNKEAGENLWQYRSHDHIIRNREDYEEHLKYIFENPARWQYDELFTTE